MAIARVGRNAIEVEVIALEDGGAYRVRNKNGKEFSARRIEPMQERVVIEPAQQIKTPPTASDEPDQSEAKASREALEIKQAEAMINSSIETAANRSFEAPEKHLSLMEAAIRVLQSQPDGSAFNTRELVAMATEQGLWTSTGAKTPEQTLYGAIFREIATKEHPRIVKAEQKGKFRLA